MGELPQLSEHIEQPVDGVQPEAAAFLTPMAIDSIGERVDFQDAIVEAMVHQPVTYQERYEYDQQSLDEAEQLLSEHGVNFPPLAAPPARELRKFSPDDWQAIRESQDPLLKLWSTGYVHRTLQHYENHGESPYHTARTPKRIQHETALVRSLPVIQRTSLRALDAAATSGVFLSNRSLLDAGVDPTAAGNTTPEDRAHGGDNYVYGDYGRPSSIGFKSEVAVVFEPEVMRERGAFFTERDIQNFHLRNPDTLELNYRDYMKGVVLPEDFQRIVMPRLLANRSLHAYSAGPGLGNSYYPMELKDFVAGSDSNPSQSGESLFSTWEAKILNQASMAYVRKLVFTTQEGMESFVAKFGTAIPCEVASPEDLQVNPKPGDRQATAARYQRNLELFGTQERYERELAQLRHEDYARRLEIVAGSEDSNEGYMLINHPALDTSDAVTYDPRWYGVTQRVFASREEALQMAHRDYDPGSEHHQKVIAREEEQVERNGVVRWERVRPRELKIYTPTITLARVQHSPDAVVITGLAVEDISKAPDQPTE